MNQEKELIEAREARMEEVNNTKGRGMWEIRPVRECKEKTGAGGARVVVQSQTNPNAPLMPEQIQNGSKALDTLKGQAGPATSVKDLEKLLQDMDVNRLRAVIYRDVVYTITKHSVLFVNLEICMY